MRQGLFLILLFLGTLALVGGMLWARLNWRFDRPPYDRHTRALDVLRHPERYAREDALRTIRTLSLAGTVLLAGALGVLAYQAFKDFAAH